MNGTRRKITENKTKTKHAHDNQVKMFLMNSLSRFFYEVVQSKKSSSEFIIMNKSLQLRLEEKSRLFSCELNFNTR